jgi:hypothetical protein
LPERLRAKRAAAFQKVGFISGLLIVGEYRLSMTGCHEQKE